jgi:osmotically inducible lipoprotein OsmB
LPEPGVADGPGIPPRSRFHRKETPMKSTRITAALAALVCAGTLSACADMTPRERNTAIGAGVGAVAGSVLTGGTTAGTIGGAAVGGVVGNQVKH